MLGFRKTEKKPSIISFDLQSNPFIKNPEIQESKIILSEEAKAIVDKDLFIAELTELQEIVNKRIELHQSDDKHPTETALPLERALEICRVQLADLYREIGSSIEKRKEVISKISPKNLQTFDASVLDKTNATTLQFYKDIIKQHETTLLKMTQVAFYEMLTCIIGDHTLWKKEVNQFMGGISVKVMENDKDKNVRVPNIIADMIASITGVTKPSQKPKRTFINGCCHASDPISTASITSNQITDSELAIKKIKELIAIARVQILQPKREDKSESAQFCYFLNSLDEQEVLKDPVRLRAKITMARKHHAAWLANTGWAEHDDTPQSTRRLISA